MTGSATHAAALKVRAKALDVAASLLQATPDELDIVDGVVVHRDRPGGGSISLFDPPATFDQAIHNFWSVLRFLEVMAGRRQNRGAPCAPPAWNPRSGNLTNGRSCDMVDRAMSAFDAAAASNNQLTHKPDNLPLALLVAQAYLEVSRVTGDPRYAGYAQAVLAPWWDLEQAPQEVLVLRATSRQRMHQFDIALVDLATVLNTNPRNVRLG
jgi:hypothetical protein